MGTVFRRAVLLSVLLLSRSALADGAAEVEVARGHFKTGLAYLDQGDYRKALQEFQAARAVFQRPEFDFNIARTYEWMGDAARAMRHYELYLAARPDAADAVETRRTVERLRRRVGTLKIVSVVPGARITVDGEPLEGPARDPVSITEGPHIVTASRDGYLSRSESVRVEAGALATVEVDPRPAGAPAPPSPLPPAPVSAPPPPVVVDADGPVPAGAAVAPPSLVFSPPPVPVKPSPSRRKLGLGLGLGLGGAALVVGAVAVGLAATGEDNWAYLDGCSGCKRVDFR